MLDWEPHENEFRPLAGEGSVVVLADGTVGSANERAAAAVGLPVRRFVGGRLHDVAFEAVTAGGRVLGADECPIVHVLRTAEPVRDVEIGLRAVGVTTWWWLACQPLVGDDGTVLGVSCTLTPVVSGAVPATPRTVVPFDPSADAADLEALAQLAGLRVPDDAPEVPQSPWARSA